MNLTKEELERLELVRTREEWEAACKAIKRAHDGIYPSDWFAKVIQSGLITRATARWGAKAEMTVRSIEPDGTVKTLGSIDVAPKN